MAEMLLINPRRRKKRTFAESELDDPTTRPRRRRRKAAAKRKPAAKRPRRKTTTRKAPVMARRRRRSTVRRAAAAPRRRRSTAVRARARLRALTAARRAIGRARRMNPRRRRRNPAMLSTTGIMGAMQQALVQGAGAVAFDVLHAQLARFMPASLQVTPGQVGIGDAVKAVATVMIGRALRGPTRGLSMRAAQGALTVQAHQLIRGFVPAGMGLGYAGPAMIANMSNRIGPNRGVPGLNAYTRPGTATPLLNAYTGPGASPLLSGSRSARVREGVSTLR